MLFEVLSFNSGLCPGLHFPNVVYRSSIRVVLRAGSLGNQRACLVCMTEALGSVRTAVQQNGNKTQRRHVLSPCTRCTSGGGVGLPCGCNRISL